MAVITNIQDLPESIFGEEDVFIAASQHGDLLHPYDTDSKLWQAHCQNGGCGTYVDDWDSMPPTDFLCDDCEAAGVSEE